MSRIRTLASLGLTAGALVVAGAVAVAAFPMLAPLSSAAAEEPTTSSEPKPFPTKLVHRVNPTYPKDAKEEGVQGIYFLEVKIDEKGQVSEARVVVSIPSTEIEGDLLSKQGTPGALAGDERLARAAIEAVRQWRYEPVLDENGQPKAVDAVLTVKFVLS